MSNLLPQASIDNSLHTLSSAKPVFFEDSFESNDFSIYQLLNLSSMRQNDDLEDRLVYRAASNADSAPSKSPARKSSFASSAAS